MQMRLRPATVAGILLPLIICWSAQAQTFTLQHNFSSTAAGTNLDGANPGSIVLDQGQVYGVTANGGTNGNGLIYRVATNGTGYTVVYYFLGNTNGAFPSGIVVRDGMIYGDTYQGGLSGVGMVFSVNTNGANFTILHHFTNQPDGNYPRSGLVLSGNTLFGTTYLGGTSGSGTVFKINTDGTGYSRLHTFTNSPDGSAPLGTLTLSGATLYGTTAFGGAYTNGLVFSITTNGDNYAVLHCFSNYPDAQYPYGELVSDGQFLYGSTSDGGSNVVGALFSLRTNGTDYVILHNFTAATDGKLAQGGLLLSGGRLYGTTSYGGAGGSGTVFELNADGSGFLVLKNFTNSVTDGATPRTVLARLGTTLWGTTYFGGSSSNGTLFSLKLSPVLIQSPQSQTVFEGCPAVFTAAAVGAGAVNYRWFFRTNTILTTATNGTYFIACAQTNAVGSYFVVATNAYGSVASPSVTLTVLAPPSLFDAALDSVTGNFSFTVTNLPSSTNRVWTTTSLNPPVAWEVIATNIMAPSGYWFFTDTSSVQTNSARFYRFSTP